MSDIVRMAMSMYIGEPCRICGVPIAAKDVSDIVWVGYSRDHKSRCAHSNCWYMRPPKSAWAFPEDAPNTGDE